MLYSPHEHCTSNKRFSMRALVYQNNVLRLEKSYQEPLPKEGEALIRVLLAGICNTDLEITRGYMAFQGILGHEFVGVVEEIYGDEAQKQYDHLIGCEVMMVGKHEEKLALAEKRGVHTYLLNDPQRFALENGRRVDMVVECTGSTQGLEMALQLVRARGIVALKSTVAEKSLIH